MDGVDRADGSRTSVEPEDSPEELLARLEAAARHVRLQRWRDDPLATADEIFPQSPELLDDALERARRREALKSAGRRRGN